MRLFNILIVSILAITPFAANANLAVQTISAKEKYQNCILKMPRQSSGEPAFDMIWEDNYKINCARFVERDVSLMAKKDILNGRLYRLISGYMQPSGYEIRFHNDSDFYITKICPMISFNGSAAFKICFEASANGRIPGVVEPHSSGAVQYATADTSSEVADWTATQIFGF